MRIGNKIPFTHTADVLTEATAEFAFLIMGAVARRLWASERLVREHEWGYWHPYLPFLGDEITGKTIAIIGTGRIGLAMIKKCTGFDMNILCYDPAYQNQEYVRATQKVMDVRHASGIQREKTWIKYVKFEDALHDADYVSVHVPLIREGESQTPTYHLFNERTLRLMKPTAYLVNTSRGPVIDETALVKAVRESGSRARHWMFSKRSRCGDVATAGYRHCRSRAIVFALCERRQNYATFDRSKQGHGGTLRSRTDRRAGRQLRR